jgi:P-type Ca2+ transporter type 2C
LLAFVVTLWRYPDQLAVAQTTALVTLIAGHLMIGWSQRSTLESVLRLAPWSNRTLLLSIGLGIGTLLPLLYTEIGRDLFRTAPLGWDGWLLALALAPVPLLGSELVKLALRRRPVPPKS